jgi:hypothetical protein
MKRSAFVVVAGIAALFPLRARAQSPAPTPALSPAIVPTPAPAPTPAPITLQAAFARLFTAAQIPATWFAPSFLIAVPIEQVRGIVASVVATLGAYQSITPNPAGFTATFARGTVQLQGLLDTTGAFTGLLVSAMQTPLIAQRLQAMFGADPVPAAWFSDRFLRSFPIDQVHATIDSIKSQGGAFLDVVPQPDGTYDLTFVSQHIEALAFLGPDGSFEVLRFRPK